MEIPSLFLDQNIPIPYPGEDEPDHHDPRNHPAILLRQVVLATEVKDDEEDVEFSEEFLVRLDALHPLRLYEEASAIAAFARSQEETTAGPATRKNYHDLGKLAMTLVNLYRPPLPSPRRGPNNPYRYAQTNGANLSHQPGAMKLRTGRGR